MGDDAAGSVADRVVLTRLEELPNVGPAVAAKLRRISIRSPQDLAGRDPYQLFDKLCRVTGTRHDPCLLDTFIAAVRFMDGGPVKPWWAYTAERKRHLNANRASSRKNR
ncbi:MAG: helix-hairpin-helix domain-containing protein [Planctomycetes bacterium]|nr:helix-hairpin-helix domain-containing protein [Planctomycetota bacterium]